MKDKKWLKEKVRDIARQVGDEYLYINIQTVLELIDQLDQPEVLSQELPVIPKFVSDYLEKAKKDKEWLKDEVARIYDTRDYWSVDDLRDEILDSINELDEPGKVVVPEFVAHWIEDLKSKKINLLESIYDFTHGEDINDYMREQSNALMRAWLDGYTVESEQKYYAKIKGHELLSDREDSYWNVDRKELYIDNIWHDYSGYKTTKLTRYDWNNLGINEDNADFVKVEELEE